MENAKPTRPTWIIASERHTPATEEHPFPIVCIDIQEDDRNDENGDRIPYRGGIAYLQSAEHIRGVTCEETLFHARLIIEAGTVFHETKLTPRQLAEQREELLEALERLARLGNGNEYGNSEGNLIAQEAILRAVTAHAKAGVPHA
jgi:hypothetical protein